MALSINLEDHFNYTLLELDGSIDAITAHTLDRAINQAIGKTNRHLILDFNLLTSISSDGLKILLSAKNRLSRFHSIALCNVSDQISSLMELSGLTRFISVNQDLHDAEILLMESDFLQGRISA